MNMGGNVVKNGIIFVGAVVASAIAGFIGYKIGVKKARKESKEEIAAARKYYESKANELYAKKPENAPVSDAENKGATEMVRMPRTNLGTLKEAVNKHNYTAHSAMPSAVVTSQEETEYPSENDYDENFKTLSPDEWESVVHYETYIYYDGDNVLVDEETDEIINIDDTIGEESLNYFGEYVKGLLYVYNKKRHQYYQVMFNHNRYTDLI